METANLEMIKTLLDSEISTYAIEKSTGVSRTMLGKYRNGDIPITNMTFETALKLTDYYQNKINDLAIKLYDALITTEKDLDYLIVRNGEALRNDETGNYQSIFAQDGYFGVYGDIVNGQVDTRESSYEEVLKAIETMLIYGQLKERGNENE